MTGETIRGLLGPVIGKSGAIYLAVSNIGQVGLAINENSKLNGVEVRPDGLVRLERETGWIVINPNEVVAVAWRNDTEPSEGQFL
jgi:hypothetical protein